MVMTWKPTPWVRTTIDEDELERVRQRVLWARLAAAAEPDDDVDDDEPDDDEEDES